MSSFLRELNITSHSVIPLPQRMWRYALVLIFLIKATSQYPENSEVAGVVNVSSVSLSSSHPEFAVEEVVPIEDIPTPEEINKKEELKEKIEEIQEKKEEETLKEYTKKFGLNETDTLSAKGKECVEVLDACVTNEDCCGDKIICKRRLCRPTTWVPIDVID